jgi:hypothetical protein
MTEGYTMGEGSATGVSGHQDAWDAEQRRKQEYYAKKRAVESLTKTAESLRHLGAGKGYGEK